jgi:spore coat protein U-like protein
MQDSGIAVANIALQSSDNVFVGNDSFTQSPTMPTVITGDSSLKGANTAFVAAAIAANGGGIVASGGSDGAMWVLFANGLILQTAAVQVALVPNGTASGSIALPKAITDRTTYNIQSSFGAGSLVNGRISADIPGTTTITYNLYNNNANTGNQIVEFFIWSY